MPFDWRAKHNEPVLQSYQNNMEIKQFRHGVRALRSASILTEDNLALLSQNIETSKTTGLLLAILQANNILDDRTRKIVKDKLKHSKRLYKACKLISYNNKNSQAAQNKPALDYIIFTLLSRAPLHTDTIIEHYSSLEMVELLKSPESAHVDFSHIDVIVVLSKRKLLTLENYKKACADIDSFRVALYILYNNDLLSQKNIDFIFSCTESACTIARLIASLGRKPWGYDLINQLREKYPEKLYDISFALLMLRSSPTFTAEHVLFIANQTSRRICISAALATLLAADMDTEVTRNFILTVSAKSSAEKYISSNDFIAYGARESPENEAAKFMVALKSTRLIHLKNLELLEKCTGKTFISCFSSMGRAIEFLQLAGILSPEKFEIICNYYKASDDPYLLRLNEVLDKLNKLGILDNKNFTTAIEIDKYYNNLPKNSSNDIYFSKRVKLLKSQTDFDEFSFPLERKRILEKFSDVEGHPVKNKIKKIASSTDWTHLSSTMFKNKKRHLVELHQTKKPDNTRDSNVIWNRK